MWPCSTVTEKPGNLIGTGSTNQTPRSEITLRKRVLPDPASSDAATLAGGITKLTFFDYNKNYPVFLKMMPSVQPY